MPEHHEAYTNMDLPVRMVYSHTPGLPAVTSGHPDGWSEEEPGTVELVLVCVGDTNILAELDEDQRRQLTSICEADWETQT